MNTLSNRSRKLLKWISKQKRWLTKAEIQKEYKQFDGVAFDAIVKAKYVMMRRSGDRAQFVQYSISDAGRAYIEERVSELLPELRNWITAAISIASFLSGLLLSEPLRAFFDWLGDLIG